jgi:hypothetical protein
MFVVLGTWEAEIGKITVQGHSGQKVSETHISTINLDMMVYLCSLTYMGDIVQRI